MRSAFLALLVLRMSQCDNTLLQPYLMDAPLTLDLDNQVFVKCRVTGAHPFHRNIHGYTEIALDVKVGLTDGGDEEDARAEMASKVNADARRHFPSELLTPHIRNTNTEIDIKRNARRTRDVMPISSCSCLCMTLSSFAFSYNPMNFELILPTISRINTATAIS